MELDKKYKIQNKIGLVLAPYGPVKAHQNDNCAKIDVTRSQHKRNMVISTHFKPLTLMPKNVANHAPFPPIGPSSPHVQPPHWNLYV